MKKNTEGKITNLITTVPDNLLFGKNVQSLFKVKLVLVNAVYFKGLFKKKFDPEDTTSDPFYLLDGRQDSCSMMNKTGSFLYCENKTFQAVRLLYQGKETALEIFLPQDKGQKVCQEHLRVIF